MCCVYTRGGVFAGAGVKVCPFWFTLKNRAIKLFLVLSSPFPSPTSSSSPQSLFISCKSLIAFKPNLKRVWLPRKKKIHVHFMDNGAFYLLSEDAILNRTTWVRACLLFCAFLTEWVQHPCILATFTHRFSFRSVVVFAFLGCHTTI